MGQRISYFKNNFDKGLKDLIVENFYGFRQWYLDRVKLSKKEYNEPYGNEILINFLLQKEDLKIDFKELDKQLLDELIAEFITDFCDIADGDDKILEFFGPTTNKRRYNESTEMVLQTNDNDFVQLWNFIIKGRSLKDNAAFNSYSNECKVGFLTFNEHRLLQTKIELHFGDIKKIKQTYWTEEEKLKEKSVIKNSKNGTYSLSGHNPKSSGLEYILQVLNQISTHKNELITVIE